MNYSMDKALLVNESDFSFDLDSIQSKHTVPVTLESANVASIFSCYVNLTNTIIGAGLLGLPYAYSNTGWILGTALMLIAGLSSVFALHILSECAIKKGGPSSFYSVAAIAMPEFTVLIDIAVAIKCFGVATSFLIVIGDLMPDVMDSLNIGGFLLHRRIWIAIGFLIVAPLSCLKDLHSLKYTSFISIGFVLFLVGVIVLYSLNIPGLDPCEDIKQGDVCVGSKSNFIFNTNTLRVFSIYVFGFTCHQNVFGVCNELINPVISRVNIVIFLSIGTAFLTYLLIAVAGYSSYGSEVESDVLVSYPTNALLSVVRLLVSLHVAFSYPLQVNPARRSILTLISQSSKKKHMAPEDSFILRASNEVVITEKVLKFRHAMITGVFLSLSFLIAITVSDLGLLLSIVGATGSTIVSYILPGFSYYLIFRNEGPVWKRYLALLQGCLGLIFIPLCLTAIFI